MMTFSEVVLLRFTFFFFVFAISINSPKETPLLGI